MYGYNPFMPFQAQPIQPMQRSPEIGSRCFFVSSADDMKNVPAELNVVNIGINKNANEIYTKQLRNDGLVDLFVYKQSLIESKSEKTETQAIIEKLSSIEQKLENMNVGYGKLNTAVPDGIAKQLPADAAGATNVVGEITATKGADNP